MVGTPAVIVTCSWASMRATLRPSLNTPMNTCFAPVSAAVYGRPQAFTWNIGTIAMTVSRSPTSSASLGALARLCSSVERCEYSTPLGLPVVPLV